ncbi:unnamed protein product [Rotaria socialis]|uniref:Reverse transcriptase domain-containing protein n=1 Tax=Rotaria socialis TaxID=392032 RepID=A0A817V236_9BILA|nr:unnamed protein product [Rotaria socialis]
MKDSQIETKSPIDNNSDRLNENDDISFHKPSRYLKMPRKFLLNSLRLQLNCSIKRKKEQRFTLSRLELFDKQFCLHQIHHLYQKYLNFGLQYQIWSDDIVQIMESTESDKIQKSLEEYLILLKNRSNQHENELIIQLSSCPTTLHSLEMIDQRLKKLVRLHHIDLVRTVNYQKHKLKDIIYEKRLFNQLSSYHLAEVQHQAIDQITTIRKKQLKIFEDLTIFEQPIICHSLPKTFDDIPIVTYQNLFGNEANKIMQELKRRKLNDQLKNYELKLQDYEDLYQTEINIFESKLIQTSLNHQHIQADIFMTLLKCYFTHHTNRLIRQIRYKEACLHVKLVRQHRRHLLLKQQIVDVYPQIIVDVPKISLNRLQLDYLSKSRPNYIRSNQSSLHSYKHQEKHVQQEHKNIMNVITRYLICEHHIPLTATIIREFSQQLEASLHQQYMIPLSYLNISRTRKELKLMKSIQHRLKKGNYNLRVTDKSGVFHIGNSVDYEKKAEAYRQKTGTYIELDSNPLWSVFDKVIFFLNHLRSKKYILSWQLDKMMPKREKIQLAYLYFIPKSHKAGTPLRPIVSSMNMPTTGISKFLDKLIRPIFDKHARSTTIIDGVDLIHRLEAYTTNGHLIPKTYLCTFDITDLYTMLPQEESLDILIEFLLQYDYQKVQNIPIDIIRKLALIVIKENVFVYENKLYRQVIGGAMGSEFTLTLANIFMWKWEKQLVHRLKVSNEIYGRYLTWFIEECTLHIMSHFRYVDDIFFTSNDSLECIDQMLDEANNFHPNIKLVRQIGRSVPFLDVLIENRKGTLTTSVYHKEAAEPYVVPFGSDHPGHVFRNTVDTAITRAVRYSTTLFEFEEEIRQMKRMFLYNGYVPCIHLCFPFFVYDL